MNDLTQEDIQKIQQLEMMKKLVLGKILTKDAAERLGRIKLVKPELADQLELYLVQLYQSGEIKQTINDEQLKELLNMLTSRKKFKLIR